MIEEAHPIVEELEVMERAVPERLEPLDSGEGSDRVPAGPVAGQGTSSSQAAGEEPNPAPPAEERIDIAQSENGGSAQVQTAPVKAEEDEEGSGRFMPRDLIAPSRHEAVVEEPEADTPTKHAEVIAFANQKGGVAKTTTTLNLAVAFAESGHRVLCIDLDPQGNLTMSQGIDPDKVEKSLYDVLVNDMPISEIIQHREIDIAVASIDLAGAEIAMSTKIGRERSLEKALKEVAGDYDFVCIDTPPSLGLLTINALTAASKVIVPVQCEYLSMRGLVQLQNTLKMIQENLNPDVRIEGILPTMLDSRTVHAKEAVEILEENFGDLVFKSRIRKTVKFAEAPVKGSSVLKYDPEGNAASYYRELAK
ncbi:MAG TPA: AAA family ATPase, partial [Solirubrobacterales bacterium]|nr:AAA family ATPase [Solirubrobacterales bacterium]